MKIEEAIETLRTAVGCCSSDVEYMALETLVSTLKEAEPIRHGHWEKRESVIWGKGLECSICKYFDLVQLESRYCPNCGAKMDGEEKQENEKSEIKKIITTIKAGELPKDKSVFGLDKRT